MSDNSTDAPRINPTITSKEQFDKLLAESKGPVVIDFMQQGCGPCAEAEPELKELMKDCEGKPVTIGSVDVEAPWVAELADKLDVAGTPTALFAPSAQDFLAGKVQEVEPSSKAVRQKLKCALPKGGG